MLQCKKDLETFISKFLLEIESTTLSESEVSDLSKLLNCLSIALQGKTYLDGALSAMRAIMDGSSKTVDFSGFDAMKDKTGKGH